MQTKTCCITGHRKINDAKIMRVKDDIKTAVLEAIEQGYTHFISGFAEGVDLYFADIVSQLKEQYHLTLEAAIPYRNRTKTKNAEFHRLLQKCDAVGIITEEYSKNCFLMRNRFMVQASDIVIAVYDGREGGGTLFTMRYAHTMGKEIKIINI